MTALALPDWNRYPPTESVAVGDAARMVRSMTYRTMTHLKADRSARNSRALNDLHELAEENGISVNCDPTFVLAKQFLLAIPSEIGTPDLALDMDGEIVFDWANARREMLTITLRADGRMSYAALRLQNDREHGTKWFSGALPPRIVTLAREIGGK